MVCHSHNDVGWLKTVDEYYYGASNNIQNAGVQYILDTVTESLILDEDRKFIEVEIGFFARWWKHQSENVKEKFRTLVKND